MSTQRHGEVHFVTRARYIGEKKGRKSDGHLQSVVSRKWHVPLAAPKAFCPRRSHLQLRFNISTATCERATAMESLDETNWDVVIAGTGLPQSLLALYVHLAFAC